MCINKEQKAPRKDDNAGHNICQQDNIDVGNNKPISSNDIYKEPVMYLISVRREMIDTKDTYIDTIPVTMNCCDYPDSMDINSNTIHIKTTDIIIGVIPAPIGTFEVRGAVKGNRLDVIGYEYPGKEPINWEAVLDEARRMK